MVGQISASTIGARELFAHAATAAFADDVAKPDTHRDT
jgi:hypothetical protein